jgi:O-antigen ligase
MPRLIKNNIISPAGTSVSRRALNNKTMKREFVFPLIIGIIAGILVMIFWQFNMRLNNQAAALVQLDQASAQNTKNVNDIITFINNATGANQKAATDAQPDTKK